MIVKDVMREERKKVEDLLFGLWDESRNGWNLDDIPVVNLREIVNVFKRAETERINMRAIKRIDAESQS